MYHPTRGGTRGGAAEFSWNDVKQDKHREFYLGHSIQAPTGRWQNGRDIHWYNRDNSGASGNGAAAEEKEADRRRQELLEVKKREQEEMNKRLGIKPEASEAMGTEKDPKLGDALLGGSSSHPRGFTRSSTGANRAPLDSSKSRWPTDKELASSEGTAELSREERHAAKKLAKMQVKEQRIEEKAKRREERDNRRSRTGEEEDESARNRRRRRRRKDDEGYVDRHYDDRDRYRIEKTERRERFEERPRESNRLDIDRHVYRGNREESPDQHPWGSHKGYGYGERPQPSSPYEGRRRGRVESPRHDRYSHSHAHRSRSPRPR